MNDDSDLEQRLHLLIPAEVPGELQRRLRATELPVRPTWLPSPSPGWLAAWLRPWPVAYAGLGATWALILLLHLLTQNPPLPDRRVYIAQAPDDRTNSTPATLTAGFSSERAFLLTRNNPESIWR